MENIPAQQYEDAEDARILALQSTQLLDSLPEQEFDDVVTLASAICGTPIALISLIDSDRQWFKAKLGLTAPETPRGHAFCSHAITTPERIMEIEDATADPRFVNNPLVTGDPSIRFYAGAPITSREGFVLGTVCVIDSQARSLTEEQRRGLFALARQTSALIALRQLTLASAAQHVELQKKVTLSLADSSSDSANLRQSQRIDVIGLMTSGIAHDFNNLLQSLNNVFFLIGKKTSEVPVLQLVENGLSTLTKGTRMISQLMAFSRVESTSATLIDVDQHIVQARNMIGHAANKVRKLTYRLDAPGKKLLCEETQLDAVLLNLVVNARDAISENGHIVISTSTRMMEGSAEFQDGEYIELAVTDNGQGMSPEVISKALTPFFTTKEAGKGTGLGLSQVHGFAQKNGGGVQIKSTENIGTTVVLLLKCAS